MVRSRQSIGAAKHVTGHFSSSSLTNYHQPSTPCFRITETVFYLQFFYCNILLNYSCYGGGNTSIWNTSATEYNSFKWCSFPGFPFFHLAYVICVCQCVSVWVCVGFSVCVCGCDRTKGFVYLDDSWILVIIANWFSLNMFIFVNLVNEHPLGHLLSSIYSCYQLKLIVKNSWYTW